MKKALHLIFFFSYIALHAQNSSLPIFVKDTTIGQNVFSDKPILGKQYLFKDIITGSISDSADNKLFLITHPLRKKYLEKKGQLLCINLSNYNIDWQAETQAYHIVSCRNSVLVNDGISTTSYDKANGKKLWQNDGLNLVYLDTKFNSGLTKDIICVNLDKGTENWSRNVNGQYGWNDISKVNDSIILLMSSGLHSVNLNKGQGWAYDFKTASKDYGKAIAMSTVGMVTGIALGIGFFSVQPDIIYNLSSKILKDDSCIYVASAKEIYCFSYSGKIIWEQEFSKKLNGQSTIYINGENVVIISSGYGLMNNKKVYVNKPFIAAYNKQNGQIAYYKELENHLLNDWQINQDTAYLIAYNKVYSFNIKNGQKLGEFELFPVEKDEGFLNDNEQENPVSAPQQNTDTYFMNDSILYIAPESGYYSLHDLYPNHLFTFCDSNIIALSHALQKTEFLKSDKLYIKFLQYKSYTFLYNANNENIIIKNNKQIAQIMMGKNSFLIHDKLYEVKKNKLYALDLNEILQ